MEVMNIVRPIFVAFFIWNFSTALPLNITLDDTRIIEDDDLKNCYSRSDPTLTGYIQNVHVGILIVDIDQISESSMINLIVLNQTTPIIIPPKLRECMWKPDIYFPNTDETKTFSDPVPNRGFKYHPSGEINWFERFMFQVSCPMNFAMYPFDSQHCVFKISLIEYSNDQVLLQWSKDVGNGGIAYYYDVHTLQFQVSTPSVDSVIEIWGKASFTTLRAHVTFYRLLTGSFVNYYMPSTLVVILSWISFYIDVEAAPARVTLGVTALLTIITQMIQARNSLPPVQYVTSMDVWLFFCLSLVFASFIEYSIAYSYRNQLKKKTRKNQKIKEVSVIEKEINKSTAWCSKSGEENDSYFISTTEKLDRISRWLFPLVMIIFCISYFSFLYRNTNLA